MKLILLCALLAAGAVSARRLNNSTSSEESILESRIVGGVTAEDGLAPYQVSIQGLISNHMCGGAIIGDKWILTAAHCIDDILAFELAHQLRIVTGTNRFDKPGAVYHVDKLIIHCNYNEPKFHNDIALIKLKTSIVFDKRTAKVDLPTEPLMEGDNLIVTGWGSQQLWGALPKDLQEATLKFVSHDRCKKLMKGNEAVVVGHICTYTKKGEGTCNGDSGGPLVRDNKLYGVVNWGTPCATGDPDMHANVYYYSDWIHTQMKGCR